MEQEGITKPVYVSPVSGFPNQKIYVALSALQGELKPIKRDATNPFFKSKYAPIEAIYDVLLPLLANNGLAITQTTEIRNDMLVLHTRLCHISGETIASEWPVAKVHQKQQEIGSALTYARRYSVISICGVTSEEDDDGNAASGKTEPYKPKVKTQAPPKPKQGRQIPSPSKPDEIVLWIRNIVQVKQLNTEMNQMLDIMEHKSLEDCSMAELKEVVKWVKDQ